MKNDEVKKIVKKAYARVAISDCGCGCSQSSCSIEDQLKEMGYTQKELNSVPRGANMGLGCGNPTALGEFKKGETVLDLGSGRGFDAFLAASKVGDKGYVIGVDMTEEMIKKAEENALKGGYKNVEFRLGDIESLPVDSDSIDVIISNCVINLAPDKEKVYKEAYRVLKQDGRMYISDIVLLKELSEEQKNDENLLAGCVSGALLKNDYLKIIKNAGFKIKGLSDKLDTGLPIESLNIVAYK